MTDKWDYSIFWKEVSKELNNYLSEHEWELWFQNIKYDHSEEKKIIIAVPSMFYRDQMEDRYKSLIEQKLYEISGQKLTAGFIVKKTEAHVRQNIDSEDNIEAPPPKTRTLTQNNRSGKFKPNLRDDYTFDNFIIGDNNSFAANAAMAISKNPGTSYNPCLIYGGVGLGKTHLIQSIGNAAYKEFDDISIVYVTAESFTNEFIKALGNKTTTQFKNKYRNVDILLIDDIHFLQKKDQTQEEIFHTFNALYDSNKQIVFTCDRPVSELRNLTDRLRNRFERGLNVDLIPPSFETRFAILKQKVQHRKIEIPDDVIELISKNVTTNVRDLEAALTKLIAYAELVNKNVTLEIALHLLKDFFTTPRQSNITINLIQKIVADYFNLSTVDLKSKNRKKTIVFPRQIAMYIARELTEYSTTELGTDFGGRDHTTVMHACQKVDNRMKSDPTLEPMIKNLIREIKIASTSS